MASSTPRSSGQVLFPGSGSTLRGGGSPMSRSRGGGGGGASRNLQCLSMIFFALTCCSFWLTIINFQKAMYDDTYSDKPNLSEQRQLVNNRIAETIKKTNIGKLGPSKSARSDYRYYDSLFYTTLQYASEAKTSIEVGCANDPFIKYLDWIDKRTCVAPYFIDYKNEDNTQAERNMNTKLTNSVEIEKVVSDFMKYTPPNEEKFDLLLCSQVLEHVPNPAAFMKKMIETAKVSIISVPFNWGNCGETCNHVTHFITQKMLLKWSYPYKPIHTAIVAEKEGKRKFDERILLVFINDKKPLKESLTELNNLLIKQKKMS